MESKNTFLAIFLSLGILLAYQFFFTPKAPAPVDQPQTTDSEPSSQPSSIEAASGKNSVSTIVPKTSPAMTVVEPSQPARDILVETSLFTAVFSEAGGTLKHFRLKEYLESLDEDSGPKELVTTKSLVDLPLLFSWDNNTGAEAITVLPADNEQLLLGPGNEHGQLVMRGRLPSGLEITRTMTFNDQDYRIQLEVAISNPTEIPMEGAPKLRLVHKPFSKSQSSRLLFAGPAIYANEDLQQLKLDDLAEKPISVQGKIDWVGHETTYFMCAVMPDAKNGTPAAHFSVTETDKSTIILDGEKGIISPGEVKVFNYTIYFGPKKLSILETVGANLDKSVDFGWFTVIARPTLYLLNLFNKYIHNYGIAIILVTILIKLAFWPIASKGMKSMKNMQKIQPKMAKIREKYKDDKERINVEMMNLYKAYKVNPVGGCLPMILQIPVFFALYKVLLQAIELRHAPFFLWINDLSAPDRLFIGFDLPYLGGLPVLTLLMGGSMFLQQKMTPTSADPAQAKVMMFLPVVFTFMFLNFASGLVLYWFVNNLLAMAQQYVINKQVDA